MKLRQIMFSQVVRLFQPTRPGGDFYMPEFVGGIAGRYGFVNYPQSAQQLLLNTSQAIEFAHGRLVLGNGNEIVVDKLSLHNDGIVAVSRSTVENTDEFCNDLLTYASDEFGAVYIDDDPNRIGYDSHIEVEMKDSFLAKLSFLDEIGQSIADSFDGYGANTYQYRAAGVSLHFDHVGKPLPIPNAFQIERRAGQPYAKNVFFSQAPLRTHEHLELLKRIEKL